MVLEYLKNVTTLALDIDKCTGCKMCTVVCPHAVFEMDEGKARIANRDACIECGACARNCAFEALRVRAGVGCATGIIVGAIRGTEPTCDCTKGDKCCG
jgi:NAD-dependent dihydropyrimidine dehydrogenase PreA subunit